MRLRPIDLDVWTRTVWGEARGEPLMGQIAVAHVILNRWWKPGWWSREKADGVVDDTIEAVCKDPFQFSVWNTGDPNRALMTNLPITDQKYEHLWQICLMVWEGKFPDPTYASLHYHTTDLNPLPRWALNKEPVVTIGRHHFYNDIG